MIYIVFISACIFFTCFGFAACAIVCRSKLIHTPDFINSRVFVVLEWTRISGESQKNTQMARIFMDKEDAVEMFNQIKSEILAHPDIVKFDPYKNSEYFRNIKDDENICIVKINTDSYEAVRGCELILDGKIMN